MLELLWRSGKEAPSTSPRTRLRELLTSGKLHPVAGVYDGLSARICGLGGFACVATSGSLIANALLGLPDDEFVTLDQLAAAVSRMTGVIGIPLYVDAGIAFGGPVSVAHAVHRLEKAGASAVRISDRSAPRQSRRPDEKGIVSIEDMAARIRAAMDARHDRDLLIVASCGAHGLEDLDEVIGRCNAYAEAGAEMTVVEGVRSLRELESIASEVASAYREADLRQVSTSGGDPPAPGDVEALGYNLMSFDDAVLRAGTAAMMEFAADLRTNGIQADLALLKKLEGLPIEDWYRFTGFDAIRAMEERFLPPAALEKYQGGPAPYYLPEASDKAG